MSRRASRHAEDGAMPAKSTMHAQSADEAAVYIIMMLEMMASDGVRQWHARREVLAPPSALAIAASYAPWQNVADLGTLCDRDEHAPARPLLRRICWGPAHNTCNYPLRLGSRSSTRRVLIWQQASSPIVTTDDAICDLVRRSADLQRGPAHVRGRNQR